MHLCLIGREKTGIMLGILWIPGSQAFWREKSPFEQRILHTDDLAIMQEQTHFNCHLLFIGNRVIPFKDEARVLRGGGVSGAGVLDNSTSRNTLLSKTPSLHLKLRN